MSMLLKGTHMYGIDWQDVKKKANAVLVLKPRATQSECDYDAIVHYLSNCESPFCGGYAEVYMRDLDSTGFEIAVCGSIPTAIPCIHAALSSYAFDYAAQWSPEAVSSIIADDAYDYEVRVDIPIDKFTQDLVKEWRPGVKGRGTRMLRKDYTETMSRVIDHMNLFFQNFNIDVKEVCVHKKHVWVSVGSVGTLPYRFQEQYLQLIFDIAHNALIRWNRTDWYAGHTCSLPDPKQFATLQDTRSSGNADSTRWTTVPVSLFYVKPTAAGNEVYCWKPAVKIERYKRKNALLARDLDAAVRDYLTNTCGSDNGGWPQAFYN